MTAKAIKIKWFVLQFGTNHFVHKNLTKYILVSIGKHRKKRGKSGKKRPEFSSSPHRIERMRGDIFFSCSQKWTRKNPETVAASGFSGATSFLVAQCGCGDRTRTCDLRVMSPTSYQLLYSAISHFVVPVTGLEPVQYRYRGILSPLCLPIPPHRQISATDNIPYLRRDVNTCLQKSSPSAFCSFDLPVLLCYTMLVLLSKRGGLCRSER